MAPEAGAYTAHRASGIVVHPGICPALSQYPRANFIASSNSPYRILQQASDRRWYRPRLMHRWSAYIVRAGICTPHGWRCGPHSCTFHASQPCRRASTYSATAHFVCPTAPTSAPHVGTQGFGDGRTIRLDCHAINQLRVIRHFTVLRQFSADALLLGFLTYGWFAARLGRICHLRKGFSIALIAQCTAGLAGALSGTSGCPFPNFPAELNGCYPVTTWTGFTVGLDFSSVAPLSGLEPDRLCLS